MASKKQAVGRPRSVMDAETCEAILRTVALGVWPDRAAKIHGVDPATMRKHKQRNADFVTELEKAEASAEAGFMAKILRHTEKQWTAAAWMLERRWGERWAKREHLTTTEDSAAQETGPTPPASPVAFAEQLKRTAKICVEVLPSVGDDTSGA